MVWSFSGLVLLLVTGSWLEAAQPPFTGVIVKDDTEVRAGAGTSYYIVGKLKNGQAVQVDDQMFEWYKIAPTSEVYSYISRAFVDARGDGREGLVNKDKAQVKSAAVQGPGLSYRTQMELFKGDRVQIVGEEGGYYKIIPPRGCYVYVKADAVMPAAMTPATTETPAPTPAPAASVAATPTTPVVPTTPVAPAAPAHVRIGADADLPAPTTSVAPTVAATVTTPAPTIATPVPAPVPAPAPAATVAVTTPPATTMTYEPPAPSQPTTTLTPAPTPATTSSLLLPMPQPTGAASTLTTGGIYVEPVQGNGGSEFTRLPALAPPSTAAVTPPPALPAPATTMSTATVTVTPPPNPVPAITLSAPTPTAAPTVPDTMVPTTAASSPAIAPAPADPIDTQVARDDASAAASFLPTFNPDSDIVKAVEQRMIAAHQLALDRRPLAELLAAYEVVARSPGLSINDQRIVAARIAQLKRDNQLADALRKVQTAQQSVAASSAVAAQAPPPVSATNKGYDLTGLLLASNVYDGVSLPRLFRVVNPADQRTLSYLRPTDAVDPREHLGRIVGIMGQSQYDASLRLRIVEPRRVDSLNALTSQ